MNKKKIQVANFNVVFLEKEKEAPLLEYFDNIVLPALRSNIRKKMGDTTYLFKDIEVREDKERGYVLTGNIVKRTILEIKSDLDDNEELIEKDEKHSSAPFSAFVIYLENHRMVFAQNQKGSPTIRNFSATIKYVFSEFIKKYNENQEKEEKRLPFPYVSIVGIPLRKNIVDALKEVDKVNKVILRFYPLNGDQEFGEMFGALIKDLRQGVGAKNGEIVLKSPKSVPGVVELITKSEGTVDPIIEVTYPDKSKGKITGDMVSERMEMGFSEENILDINEVISQGNKIENTRFVSEENRKIYKKNEGKIIKFIKR